MNKLILIDADGLVFHSLRDSLEESLQVMNEKIQNMFEKTGATHYVFFISNGRYFRHLIDPNYKISRDKYRDKASSKWVKVLKQYLVAQWNAQFMEGVEADDMVSYWYNQEFYYGLPAYTSVVEGSFVNKVLANEHMFCNTPEKMEKIICSPDKDILQSIPGKHFNYSYKLENKDDPNSVMKGYWVETGETECQTFIWKQMITGDATDGIAGLSGKGEAYFKKICNNQIDANLPFLVAHEYMKHYGNISTGIYEYQKNYRLLHMLNCDEDFMREVGKLPEFPVISEVPKIQVPQVVESNYEF